MNDATHPLAAAVPQPEAEAQKAASAKEQYDELGAEADAENAIERLRFFCSLAMSGQDWMDVEPFFDAVIAEAGAPVPEQRQEAAQVDEDEDWLDYEAALVIPPASSRVAAPTPQAVKVPLTEDEKAAFAWIERLNTPDFYQDRIGAAVEYLKRHGIHPTEGERSHD